jgi:lysophospholipase L1-like esterase
MINDYTYDGVHPNEAGYDVMELSWKKQLKKF